MQNHEEVGGECFADIPCRCGQQALLPGCKLLLIHLSADCCCWGLSSAEGGLHPDWMRGGLHVAKRVLMSRMQQGALWQNDAQQGQWTLLDKREKVQDHCSWCCTAPLAVRVGQM